MAPNFMQQIIGVAVLSASILFLPACSAGSADLETVKEAVAKAYTEVPQWSVAEAKAAMEGAVPPVVLDVREREEYEVSHLDGAIQIAPDTEADAVLRQLPAGRKVLLYCSVGYRSSDLARRLLTAGRDDVVNLEGSLFEWANRGLPLFDAEGPTEKVHGYNRRWGRFLNPNTKVVFP